MKAQLEETVDAALKVGLLRDELMAEDALRRGEDYLRLTIDTIPGLAWCSRPDGSNEFLNQRWLDYTGLTIEEARGSGWQVAIHPDDLPQLLDVWQGLLASGKPGELEARLRRADRVYRWFLFRVEPLRDSQGNIVKWYGTNTDLRARNEPPRKGGILLQSIFGDELSINAFVGADDNPRGMKASKRTALSVDRRAIGLPSTSAQGTVIRRRQRLFVSVAFLLAVLTSGCQTFNMTPEKFAEQQMGHYDCTPEARTVVVAGSLLYFLSAFSGRRMPDSVPVP